MTDVQKGQIMLLASKDKSPTEIGKELGIPWSTVNNFIMRWHTCGTHKNQLHLGGPQRSTAAEDRALIELSQTNTCLTHIDLRDQVNSTLSLRSIHC